MALVEIKTDEEVFREMLMHMDNYTLVFGEYFTRDILNAYSDYEQQYAIGELLEINGYLREEMGRRYAVEKITAKSALGELRAYYGVSDRGKMAVDE